MKDDLTESFGEALAEQLAVAWDPALVRLHETMAALDSEDLERYRDSLCALAPEVGRAVDSTIQIFRKQKDQKWRQELVADLVLNGAEAKHVPSELIMNAFFDSVGWDLEESSQWLEEAQRDRPLQALQSMAALADVIAHFHRLQMYFVTGALFGPQGDPGWDALDTERKLFESVQ